MKLPNHENAVISQEKLQNYLLSKTHPIGRFKASIFNELGYRQREWAKLQTDLKRFLELEADEKETTAYGHKYEIRGNLLGPSGKSIYLVTAWIVLKTEDFPPLTAMEG